MYAENIIATLREPFLVLNRDLRVKTANRSFLESFHVSHEETENRLVYDLGDGQWDIPLLRTLLNEVLSKDHPIHDFVVEHRFPDIGQRTMLLNARKFTRESNAPPLILLAIEDVTERRRLERQMQEQAAALADLDHRKDEFLAMLSHELRNPLAAILNAVQVLQLQKSENSAQQKAQAIIERQVGQLTHLVDDLLDVSRTITGRIQLRLERIDVGGIVERAVETARPSIDQRKHELTVSLPPDPIWLYADAVRLEQVVTNLLTNAVKYTDEGGHIGLSVQQEGERVVLRVRDTGLGITPAFLPHVFDLFTQAERSSDRSQGGLGIGLAVVKRLVEMHEGTIEVSSTLGQGSEFVVSLAVDRPMALSRKTHPPSPERAKSAIAALRVLIVDDNVDAATALELLLQASGHLVRVTHTGPTGLAAALEFRPDVVLLDIGLPELDGWNVAKRIRQQPILDDIVLVAITGYGQNPDRQRSQKAGFDHHLVKPVDFATLRQLLVALSEKADCHGTGLTKPNADHCRVAPTQGPRAPFQRRA
jgi:signal transduction histidine kinase/ActR/RegA family two-component response regulator